MILCTTDDLEPVACRLSIAKFKSLESDSHPEQMGAEVKCMNLACAISETHGLEPGVFESLQSGNVGNFPVKALATKLR
jgi:hypothetical protein